VQVNTYSIGVPAPHKCLAPWSDTGPPYSAFDTWHNFTLNQTPVCYAGSEGRVDVSEPEPQPGLRPVAEGAGRRAEPRSRTRTTPPPTGTRPRPARRPRRDAADDGVGALNRHRRHSGEEAGRWPLTTSGQRSAGGAKSEQEAAPVLQLAWSRMSASTGACSRTRRSTPSSRALGEARQLVVGGRALVRQPLVSCSR
jgi:hypothetical protein